MLKPAGRPQYSRYDAMGNITSRTVSGASETYNYDPNHPCAVDTVTSGGSTIYSASYDADGNMTSRNGYSIQWTPSNLPSSMASANGSSTFSYDPDHARYYQSATFNGNTTNTTYIGGLFEVVSTSTDTQYRHNILADGQVIAVHTIDQSGAASTSYLHYDHLGSVDAITDDQGSVIQAMSFDAFGLRRDATNWDYDLSQNTISTLKNYTDRGYTDQEQLDNLSLVDMNGRVYDPTIGRMISTDPTISEPFFSQAFNRYSYVDNSPLESTDPSGFDPASPPCPGGPSTCKKQDSPGSGNNNQSGNQNGDQSNSSNTTQLGSISVTGNRIGDNTNQPGGTNLSNCNCVVNGPSSGPGQGNNGTGPGPGKNSKQSPQQKSQLPKQRPKQSCNQNIVKGANIAYDFGVSMQKAGGAGMLLASPAIETPPGAALEIAGGLVATGGAILQGGAALVLYQETGDTTPLVNSTIGIGVSDTLDFLGTSQPANAATNTVVGNILGDSNTSCAGP